MKKVSTARNKIEGNRYAEENEDLESNSSLSITEYGLSKQKIQPRKKPEKLKMPNNFKSRSPFPLEQPYP